MSIILQNDDKVTLTLLFTKNGKEVAAPADVAAWTNSDAAVATLSVASGPSVDLLSVANGSDTVTVTVGALTATLDVSVVDPAPDAVAIVASVPVAK